MTAARGQKGYNVQLPLSVENLSDTRVVALRVRFRLVYLI